MYGLGIILFYFQILNMEDNVHMSTIPVIKVHAGNSTDEHRRSHSMENMMHCLLETACETKNQMKAMNDSLQAMTSQFINVVARQIDVTKSNQ